MIISDQISADIVENICSHLYSEIIWYEVGYYINDLHIWWNAGVPTWKYSTRKYNTHKFKNLNSLNKWISKHNRLLFNNCTIIKNNHIRGGTHMLNLRTVCKAFNRAPLNNLIIKYDLQFQKNKYTYILFENLRFKDDPCIFPAAKDHQYYRRQTLHTCKWVFPYKMDNRDSYRSKSINLNLICSDSIIADASGLYKMFLRFSQNLANLPIDK
jgi:hypothetical protein